MTMTMTRGRGRVRSRSRNLSGAVAGAGNFKNGRLRQPWFNENEQMDFELLNANCKNLVNVNKVIIRKVYITKLKN